MCIPVLWNTNGIAVLTGRTMDWPESTEPLIVAFPRGLERDGGLMVGEVVVAETPLRWTSAHASLATTVYGIGTVDGFNERGFAVHALYLKSTDVGASTVCDLTNRTYLFELKTSPSVIWVELGALNLEERAQPLAIDPYDISLTGNVTDRFAPRQIGF